MDKKRRDASARVAFAALLHDLGKFAERGRVGAKDSRLDSHKQIYCPQPFGSGPSGRFTHVHAAFTALVFDEIEQDLPPLTDDCAPFAPRRRAGENLEGEPDDSLVNAAAKHHKPETFLQWMIACGDRIASGFEREAWEAYNAAPEPEDNGADRKPSALSHYRARLLTLFAQISLEDGEGRSADADAQKALRFRYRLQRLSPTALTPVDAGEAVPRTVEEAQEEYRRLWDEFAQALSKIPRGHRRDWALWLDHFDTLWLQFTHAIPSATAGSTKPEVSLYDHSKTTAALATALWRYHHDRGDDPEAVAARQKDRSDWDEPKFLLIQGDLFGIQRFIFSSGGETNKGAAKILRGRSAYVSLLAECAALKLLEALDLPPTSQIINAAGKFLIVGPNTEEARKAVEAVKAEIDAWFLEHGFGEAGLGIAYRPASPNDFVDKERFRTIQQALVDDLDVAKHQRFGLCGDRPPEAVFHDAAFPHGVCAYQGRWPAEVKEPLKKPSEEEADAPTIARLTRDQLTLGRLLAQQKYLRLRLWRGAEVGDQNGRPGREELHVPIFGYRLAFAALTDEEGAAVNVPGLLPARVWDLSLPQDADAAPWHGLAWRAINAYVPIDDQDTRGKREELYALAGVAADEGGERGGARTFHELAAEALILEEEEAGAGGGPRARGVPALMVAKGDIDNLGQLFEKGLAEPTFAKWAALSRQVNAFFTLTVPWLLKKHAPEVYTVFAGGDDFFFIGPWRRMPDFVTRLREEFRRYVAENPDIHFSLALVMVKPQVPITTMARMAEEALDNGAKRFDGRAGLPAKFDGRAGLPEKLDGRARRPEKNAVSCFGEVVSWGVDGPDRDGAPLSWGNLEERYRRLEELRQKAAFSSGYLYDLLRLVDMRNREEADPRAAGWRALLRYRTRRYVVERLHARDEDERAEIQRELLLEVGHHGIENLGSAYRIALFRHLYEHRGYRKGERR